MLRKSEKSQDGTKEPKKHDPCRRTQGPTLVNNTSKEGEAPSTTAPKRAMLCRMRFRTVRMLMRSLQLMRCITVRMLMKDAVPG